MYDVVIIGAGPAGIICASNIKENNKKLNVLILEKNDKLGKKLSMTGNGRCNLGNLDTNINNYFSNSSLDNFKDSLKSNEYLEYIKKIGILIKEEDKRLYPYSNQAITICKTFERYLNYLGVKIKYNYEVLNVKKENDIFIINNDIKSKNIVIATGGLSYPKTGSTGTGYDILKSFGHKIEKIYPSLTYLNTNYKYIKELQGVRFDSIVSLSINNKIIDKEKGQVQFTKDALSGICVFNLSRNVKKYLEENKKVKLILNLVPDYSKNEIKDYINPFKKIEIEDVLSGILNNKLALVIAKELKLYGKKIKELTNKDFEHLLYNLHNMEFNITNVGDISSSQVTVGGVSLDEFTSNLESKKVKGLYAIGEVLDVDGKCGGYNLSWAFTSGLIVSRKLS